MTRRIRTLAVACLAVIGCADQPSESAGSTAADTIAPAFSVVTGSWSAVAEDGGAIKVDGTQWSDQTKSPALEATARALFGTVDPGFVANTTSPGAFPLAVWQPLTNFQSGTIRVQFKMLGGESDQNAGIVFGLQPNGEYHYVRFNTKDGNVALWRYAKGERELIVHGTSHDKLALNEWHDLAVTVAGTKVSGRVNNRIGVEHTLAAPISGRVGLWTKRDAITAFKDFQVEAQPTASQE